MPPRHDCIIKYCLSKYGDFEELECQWESKRVEGRGLGLEGLNGETHLCIWWLYLP